MNEVVLNCLIIMLVLSSMWTVFNCLDKLFEFVSKIFNKTRCLK